MNMQEVVAKHEALLKETIENAKIFDDFNYSFLGSLSRQVRAGKRLSQKQLESVDKINKVCHQKYLEDECDATDADIY